MKYICQAQLSSSAGRFRKLKTFSRILTYYTMKMADQKYVRPEMSVLMDQLKQLETNDRRLRLEVERLHEKNHRLEAALERLDVLYIEQHHYFKRITQARVENGSTSHKNPATGYKHDHKQNMHVADSTEMNFDVQNSKKVINEHQGKTGNMGTLNPAYYSSIDYEDVPTDTNKSQLAVKGKESGPPLTAEHRKSSWLSKARSDYRDTLTIPGLKRISSRPIIEKIIWSMLVAAALGLAIYFVWEIWHQFSRKELMSHIQIVAPTKQQLPSITVCNDEILLKNLQCYKNSTASGDQCGNNTYHSPFIAKSCQLRDASCIDRISMSPWEPGCITINHNGTMYQEGILPLTEFVLVLKDYSQKSRTYTIFLHNSTEKATTIHGFGQNKLYPGEYQLLLEQTIYDRHGSECISSEDIFDDLLPGKYTRYGCLDSCWIKQLFTTCNAVPDLLAPYLPLRASGISKENSTDNDKRKCIATELERLLAFGSTNCICKNACYETRFKAEVHPLNANAGGDLTIQIAYTSLSYEYIKDRPIYSSAKLLSDIGGIFGLFLGASFLAVLEVIAYIYLLVAKAFVK